MRGATLRYMSDRAPARAWYTLVIETIALRGMTKSQLSDRSGVSRPTIERWSTGRRTPQAAPVNAVADVLGIDRRRAHELAGIVGRAEPKPEDLIPPDVLAVIRKRYPSEQQQQQVIEALVRLGEPTGPPEAGESPEEPARQAG